MWSVDPPPRELGAATLLAAAVVALSALLVVVVADIGIVLGARVRGSAAADAAALAAAAATFDAAAGSPEVTAAEWAWINGARLIDCMCPADPSWEVRTVTVVVSVAADTTLAGTVRLRVSSSAEYSPVSLFSERDR